MNDWQKITLESLSGGAALERFQEALAEVIENILDPNTEANKVREIKLSVKMKPDHADREKVVYSLSIDKKLAPPRDVNNIMYVGDKNGEKIAYEQQADQGNLFNEYAEKVKQINLKEVEND